MYLSYAKIRYVIPLKCKDRKELWLVGICTVLGIKEGYTVQLSSV